MTLIGWAAALGRVGRRWAECTRHRGGPRVRQETPDPSAAEVPGRSTPAPAPLDRKDGQQSA
jgi:hypothetical protein